MGGRLGRGIGVGELDWRGVVGGLGTPVMLLAKDRGD